MLTVEFFVSGMVLSVWAVLWLRLAARKGGRPWLSLLCLLILVLLPLLWCLPKYQWQVLSGAGGGVPVAEAGGVDVGQWCLLLWFAGVAWSLFRLFRDHRALRSWVADSRVVTDEVWLGLRDECVAMLGGRRCPDLRIKAGIDSPVVAGLWKPCVLMPEASENWHFSTRRMALLHELAHVQRKDLWSRWVADVAVCLHWYNPLVRWIRSQWLGQCEYACDAEVVAAGADKRLYLSALCDVVESALKEKRPHGVLAMSDHAPLNGRVDRLLAGGSSGGGYLGMIFSVLTVMVGLGLATVRPVAVVGPVYPSAAGEWVERDTSALEEEVERRHAADPFPGNG